MDVVAVEVEVEGEAVAAKNNDYFKVEIIFCCCTRYAVCLQSNFFFTPKRIGTNGHIIYIFSFKIICMIYKMF